VSDSAQKFPVRALTIVNTMATVQNTVIIGDRPILECELPLDNSRVEALIPPLVERARFAQRARRKFQAERHDSILIPYAFRWPGSAK
jgi:Type II/IV secretion system protein.